MTDGILLNYIKSIGGSNGIVFVGANTGDELPYLKCLGTKIYVFEPITDPSVINQLKSHADDNTLIYNYAISDFNGSSILFPAGNNYQSSSLLKPTKHLEEFPVPFFDPIKVECRRLDSFDFFKSCDVLLMDVQGAELNVLNGISNFSNLKLIYCEYTSFRDLYENQCLFKHLNAKLEFQGFHFCETLGVYRNPESKVIHGNAIWRKI